MEPYIFTERKGVHIIDLEQTMESIQQVTEMVTQRVADGETLLFVGTKRQAQESLEEEAIRCGMPYVNHRWLGGTLTNFKTIRKSVDKLKELERMEEENVLDRLSNTEARRMVREKNRLQRNLSGIRDMESLPDMVFITDLLHEQIAVREARKLEIPIIGILDTNCDPEDADYPIPGNDDAIRALGLYSEIMADAVIEGRELREQRLEEEGEALDAEELEEDEVEAEVIEAGEDGEAEAEAEASSDEVDKTDSSDEAEEDPESSDAEEDGEDEPVEEAETAEVVETS